MRRDKRVSACLSVCLPTSISRKLHVDSLPVVCILPETPAAFKATPDTTERSGGGGL